MKTFVTRSLSATVFAVVMLGGILWNDWSFTILFFIINAGALWEYYKLVSNFYLRGKISPHRYRYIGVALGSIFYCVFSYFLLQGVSAVLGILFALLIPLLLVFFVIELYSYSENGIVNAALNVFGLVYISFPLALLQCIATRDIFDSVTHSLIAWVPHRTDLILGILLLIWTNDTFAYIGGSLIGKRKLFPSISPGKSWEGFFSGLIGSVILGYVLSVYFIPFTVFNWIMIALIVSLTGTLGDLFESLLKRNAGVKDSGAIMPGHGGFLDRFDAFIFCIPFVYLYITLFQV